MAATTFASNVVRLRTLALAAVDAGRSVVIAGRAMRRMIETAVLTGQIERGSAEAIRARQGDLDLRGPGRPRIGLECRRTSDDLAGSACGDPDAAL